MNHLLEVKNIQTCFLTDGTRVRAVDGVSLHLDRGEVIGIVGESGSGKSVTMMSVLQLIGAPGQIEGGEVRLDGVERNLLDYEANSTQMRDVRGGRISMIFQEPMTSLNPVLTIGYQIQENIMLHLKLDKEEAKNVPLKCSKW